MKAIVNFIQFVRGVEPRDPELDLFEPVREQIAILRKYGFRGTLLLQYDAMIQPEFQQIAKEAADCEEIGLWLEAVQPLVEAVGLRWRGRRGFSWDWHCHCDALIGYTPEERKLLIDEAIRQFREIFGFTPKVAGAWVLDAVSLAYLRDRYGIVAACNCKEQWGTDGYTLWGGFGSAYYPSRKNVLCPAQTVQEQIDVPVFRMLGADPVYQYDVFLSEGNDVITLEPASGIFGGMGGGSSPDWVDWYFRENFTSGRGISLAYAQTGQENSFGWAAIGMGLPYQAKKIAELRDRGEVEVLTLGEAGEWFSATYASTPVTAQAAMSDWKGEGRKSIWYYSARYRVNLYIENGEASIRDCYLFDENYPERYLEDVCRGDSCLFDNLPVWDGMRWSKGKKSAKLRIAGANGERVGVGTADYREEKDRVCVTLETSLGRLEVEFAPECIEMRMAGGKEFSLIGDADPAKVDAAIEQTGDRALSYEYRGHRYGLGAERGRFAEGRICSEQGTLSLAFRISKDNFSEEDILREEVAFDM